MSNQLSAVEFPAFYEALHGYPPFPWQTLLAERVIREGWPAAIDLPTGSGKTAAIDIAIFALAVQADLPAAERTAPRRIFFVVDRRIVVDEAYERAREIANRLALPDSEVVARVAARLEGLAGADPGATPLAVTRMRGGIARDDGWVRSLVQPAVITSTVDQLGSRLLFRGYGRRPEVAAVDAALTGNDALIILDEAHCAVPFSQTLRAVARYRSSAWARRPVRTPFRTVIMSATPPDGTPADEVFPNPALREAALDSPLLRERIEASKPAELVVARTPRRPRKGEAGLRGERVTDDPLVLTAADRALKLAAGGRRRIAVMVNRVATARAIVDSLRTANTEAEGAGVPGEVVPEVVLMTGRMRPLDRDQLVRRWEDALKSSYSPAELARPVIVVATQTLEVGADFSFDALITECASLDALRQRFGRLDRLGRYGDATAAILIRRQQVRTPEQIARLEAREQTDDPVYGNALAETWNWLSKKAEEHDSGVPVVDMGIAAFDALLPTDRTERRTLLARLSAPVLDSPVLFPAHLDLLAQTSPRPSPDPDVSVFLRGPQEGEPDVSIVFRRDLDPEAVQGRGATPLGENWNEALTLLPPSSQEAFTLPLSLVRRWLSEGEADTSALHDLEAPVEVDEGESGRRRLPVVLWRGRDRSVALPTGAEIRPGDLIVVPAAGGVPAAFAGAVQIEGDEGALDIAEAAHHRAGDRVALRVNSAVLAPWRAHPGVAALLEWAAEPDRELERDDLEDRLRAVAEVDRAIDDGNAMGPVVPELPEWLIAAATELSEGCEVIEYPKSAGGGYLLRRRAQRRGRRQPDPTPFEHDPFADADDLVSAALDRISLGAHLQDTAALARAAVEGTVDPDLAGAVVRAAELHDLGKLDPRFQQMLHGGNELAAHLDPVPLAKSPVMPTSMRARRRARELAGLPQGFRHELLSTQLVERYADLPDEPTTRELILHLIATHHGYCRPFAPVLRDPDPPGVELEGFELAATFVGAEERAGWTSPHRLDSGIADRFWSLIGEFGWWGLAYLEAVVRLADWAASAAAEAVGAEPGVVSTQVHAGG